MSITYQDSTISMVNADQFISKGIGEVQIPTKLENNTLKQVLYIPSLSHNLLLVHALTKEGNDITFGCTSTIIITDENYNLTKISSAIGNLNYLHTDAKDYTHVITTMNINSYTLWH